MHLTSDFKAKIHCYVVFYYLSFNLKQFMLTELCLLLLFTFRASFVDAAPPGNIFSILIMGWTLDSIPPEILIPVKIQGNHVILEVCLLSLDFASIISI